VLLSAGARVPFIDARQGLRASPIGVLTTVVDL
jgi:hypothetical protein